MSEKVICMSQARIVVEELAGLTEAMNVLSEALFAEIERLADQLQNSLEAEAAQQLVRRSYTVDVKLKDSARSILLKLDAFDVRLLASET